MSLRTLRSRSSPLDQLRNPTRQSRHSKNDPGASELVSRTPASPHGWHRHVPGTSGRGAVLILVLNRDILSLKIGCPPASYHFWTWLTCPKIWTKRPETTPAGCRFQCATNKTGPPAITHCCSRCPFWSGVSLQFMRLAIQPAFDFQPSDPMQSKPDKSFAAIHGSTAVTHLKFMKKRLAMLLVISGLAVCAANVTQAAVTVTAATGGTIISADKAQNAAAPAFTTLGDILIAEGASGDFPSQTGKSLILTAPSGWRFNAGTGTATAAKISGGEPMKSQSIASRSRQPVLP